MVILSFLFMFKLRRAIHGNPANVKSITAAYAGQSQSLTLVGSLQMKWQSVMLTYSTKQKQR